MKITVTICRWLVGLLFIFSGLIKANDPLGLSYKMLEFFEKWELHFFDNYSLAFAFVINIVEVVAGIGIIIGWKPKFFTWLLLLLILFFTFLTSYVLFSGKIHACGCFGDCVPLTPIQTFTKDIILLVLVLIILFAQKSISQTLTTKVSIFLLLFTFVVTAFIEFFVLKHLPFKDCLAYKKGNNIVAQMKVPVGCVTDSFLITTKYNRNGKEIEIIGDNFPADFDSTYVFIEGSETQKQIRVGNCIAKIPNFSLTSVWGNDSTTAILSNEKKYVLVFIKDFETVNNKEKVKENIAKFLQQKIDVYIVTNDKEGIKNCEFKNVPIFTCDATEIKTAARANATFLLMQNANILNKLAGIDAENLMK